MRLRASLLLTCLGSMVLTLAGCGGSSSNNPPTPPAVSIAFTTQPASNLTVGATTSFSATVMNDSANAGVAWTVSCGSTACGSFSAASTPSGMATTYTAPAIVPTGNTVTVTGTSVTDKTKTVTDTITIAAAAPITVTLSPAAPTTLMTNAPTSLIAVVANDSANAGVTWSVTCTTSPCGSFSATSTASGMATTYTAPATAANVTVVATSVTDKTKTASATIMVTTTPPPVGITVALSQAPPASLTINQTASITATVSNDSASGGVTWTVTCGSNSCGAFSSTTTGSGTATTYTAPSAIPSGGTVTVTATSVTDKTKTASATITITGLLADGKYVFHVSGEDTVQDSGGNLYPSPYFVAGAFTVQNGVITGGEQDFIDQINANVNVVQTISSSGTSLGRASSGNLQVTLNVYDPTSNTSLVEVFNGVAVSSSRVLINEFDSYASSTGSIDLQTSAAAPSAGYVFTFNGLDSNSNANQYFLGMGGVLNISGNTISNTGSVYDCNDGLANITTDQSFSSGTVSAPDTFGRVVFTLNPVTGGSSACQLSQMIFAGYMNGNQIQLVETGTDTYGGTLGGVALAQGKNTGLFTPASINGQTYVFSAIGADPAGELTLAGAFQFNSGGLAGSPYALNDLSLYGATTITGGTYAVDPTGRVSMIGIVTAASPSNPNLPGNGFQLYLDGNGNALELGLDSTQVTTGMAYQQTSGTLPTSGNSGILGQGLVSYDQAGDLADWSATGPISFSSTGFSGTFDYNQLGAGQLFPNQTLAPTTVNTSTGVITMPSPNFDFNNITDEFNYYVIDGSRVLMIETDGNQLGLLQIEPVK